MRKLSLSVFFPCYNEEANVERTTLAALATCQAMTDDFEIIIVNDGSKDRTGELADKLAAEHEPVRAVHNRRNRGYGGALQTGFRNATKEWVFYTDGDGQFDFKEMFKLLPVLDGHDIVSGFRIDRSDPLVRRINGWGWTLLCNMLLGTKLRDIDCAFKLFPRKLFDEITMRSEGALIDAEILAKASHRGYRIGQVGIHHYPRKAGQQTGANLLVIIRAFKELLLLRKHILAEKKANTQACT